MLGRERMEWMSGRYIDWATKMSTLHLAASVFIFYKLISAGVGRNVFLVFCTFLNWKCH